MSKSSTKQFDAIWILHSANSDRSYLNFILSKFEALFGADMRKCTTVIISKCDEKMLKGDFKQYPNKEEIKIIMKEGKFFQCPNTHPFILPKSYEKIENK